MAPKSMVQCLISTQDKTKKLRWYESVIAPCREVDVGIARLRRTVVVMNVL